MMYVSRGTLTRSLTGNCHVLAGTGQGIRHRLGTVMLWLGPVKEYVTEWELSRCSWGQSRYTSLTGNCHVVAGAGQGIRH